MYEVLPACVSVPRVCSVRRVQKVSDSFELELWVFVIYHAGTRNQTMSSGRAANTLNLGGTLTSLTPLGFNLPGGQAAFVESPETRPMGNSS